MAANLKEVTADGEVVGGDRWLKSATLTAGADAATLVLRDGGASGTIRLTIKAAANTTAQWRTGDSKGAYFDTSIYADLTGTSPTADVEYE